MEDILYTVNEVSKLLKSNTDYVYQLIRAGLLPVLKLGNYKVRKKTLLEFLEKYEGKDLTNPQEIKDLVLYVEARGKGNEK
jgi:excisionase family DNA binding protein